MAATVFLEAHPHHIREGEWCDACAAPTVQAFDLSFAATGLRHLGTVTAWACSRCDRLDITR